MREGPPRKRGMKAFAGAWKGLTRQYSHEPAKTGVARDELKRIVEAITKAPDGFAVNPKVTRILDERRADFAADKPVDWACGESLAFGSLLAEGTPVRLSGQDSRRGTFSHRHAVLVDVHTGARHVPLAGLAAKGAYFSVYDSSLSEEAVLGFEFGYSTDAPQTLVMWEAQFGDFVNGAQNIIDQFVVSSESKWQRSSGVVLMLPHGYEGQGPEHSSARLERFLQSCAEDNIQVCNPTLPAQLFHVLRRQMKRAFRKPLVLMTPKSLLRHKEVVSPIAELADGTFREVLDDPTVKPEKVRRVVLCSGKVYYDLTAPPGADGKPRTDLTKADDVAVIRLEQLYPFPEEQLRRVLSRYKVREWVWAQEESQNMGAWSFVEPRLRGMGVPVKYVGRDASASPAVGSLKIHQREQAELVEAALRAEGPHVVGRYPGGSSMALPVPPGKQPV